ncbi:MAG: dockerin type I repeat-containing protein [Blautia sp.]|nr:dockerin type I repeat-containing protein [Blautia sp.]
MKKFAAYLLACALILVAVGVNPAPVRADVTNDGVFEARLVTASGSTTASSTTTNAPTLNVSDKVELRLYAYGARITGFSGVLEYDQTALSIGDIPSVYTTYNYTTGAVDISAYGGELPKDTSNMFTSIPFTVTRSVVSTTVTLRNVLVSYRNNNGYIGLVNYGTVRATLTSSKVKNVTLASSNASGTGSVTVPVRLTANDGFTEMELTASYDSSRLTLDSVTFEDPFKSKLTESTVTNLSNGKALVKLKATDELKDTGLLLNMNFKTASAVSTTTSGTAPTTNVLFTVDSIRGKEEIAYNANDVTSTVTLGTGSGSSSGSGGTVGSSSILGDVNGNGKVDLVDALYVVQYYNDVKTLTAAQQTNADVNKDGKVNLVDATLIMRYYNGSITSFN